MMKPIYRSQHIGNPVRMVIRFLQVALVAPGAMIIELAPALALDDSNTSAARTAPLTSFTSSEEALRVGEENLRAGNMEASVAGLTYAAANGQLIARWKLGQMYANGDGVPRDNSKAYEYFNKLVEDYDEDQPEQQNVSAISDAFVAVGVYCLNGIPNSDVRPDPQRAHELFQRHSPDDRLVAIEAAPTARL